MNEEQIELEEHLERFQQYVFSKQHKDLTIIEIITDYCENNSIEVEDVVHLISPSLLEQIEIQCSERKQLKEIQTVSSIENLFS